MANQLSIANVINISVLQPGLGLLDYNTSNLALFTGETSSNIANNALGYGIYLSPADVATDFGSSSVTYQMALSVFSQQPNILANSGALIIIPFLSTGQTAVQGINFVGGDGVPVSGHWQLLFPGPLTTAQLAYNATASAVQTAIRALAGGDYDSVVVTGSVADGFIVTFDGIGDAVDLMQRTGSDNLVDVHGNPVLATPYNITIGSGSETLDKAIIRTESLVQYFGVMEAQVELNDGVTMLAAEVVQSLNKLMFSVQYDPSTIAGIIDQLRTAGLNKTRSLFYDNSDTQGIAALIFMAAYAGRALSVNFNGSNTTSNMHLKTLKDIQPDPLLTQTLLNQCLAAGADTYPSLQGVPKVFCSGSNSFFDQVYNLGWFVGALEVAGFNALAQVGTKLPQTEGGVSMLKGAYQAVCEQAITNGYLAPGAWTSADTFGNQQLLLNNITQRGYYIYSAPVSQQLPTARAARQAPLIQIAAKEAGAIDSSNVIVAVNA